MGQMIVFFVWLKLKALKTTRVNNNRGYITSNMFKLLRQIEHIKT